jgi:hypothetical protein
MNRSHINPMQWHSAVGLARQICARIFRDGGTPADAMIAFGLTAVQSAEGLSWSKAVDAIAERLCLNETRKAA